MAVNPVKFLLWLIVLLVVGIPLAIFCAIFWVIFIVLEQFCHSMKDGTKLMRRGMEFPATCAHNMVHRHSHSL
eukprot:m.132268 g.132268  ORF g.132268 m.132268 type:complete len:73 (-) comp20058_c1_seq1:96-314(-)